MELNPENEVPDYNELIKSDYFETFFEYMENTNLSEKNIQNTRIDKKTKKALEKLGLVKMPGFTQIVIRRKGNTSLVISNPEVYKSSISSSFVVFGDVRVHQGSASSNGKNSYLKKVKELLEAQKKTSIEKESTNENELVNGANEEISIEDHDIEIVMKQTNASREKAIETLKRNNGDIVNSIMELTEV